MTKYFKVKTGFGADDFISITQDELRRAVTAQVTGKVGIFNEGTIAGNSIISITPDFNREMGYHRDYRLTGEDYEHIGREKTEESRVMLQEANDAIQGRSRPSEEASQLAGGLAEKMRLN